MGLKFCVFHRFNYFFVGNLFIHLIKRINPFGVEAAIQHFQKRFRFEKFDFLEPVVLEQSNIQITKENKNQPKFDDILKKFSLTSYKNTFSQNGITRIEEIKMIVSNNGVDHVIQEMKLPFLVGKKFRNLCNHYGLVSSQSTNVQKRQSDYL